MPTDPDPHEGEADVAETPDVTETDAGSTSNLAIALSDPLSQQSAEGAEQEVDLPLRGRTPRKPSTKRPAEPALDEPTSPPQRPPVGGWARVDADGVLRGWVTDRTDRDRRLLIAIFIDAQKCAEMTALRFDQKLIDLDEADGRYSFAYAVPARFRDGETHGFEVRATELGFVLRSKSSTFQISREETAPEIVMSSFGLRGARGWLYGGGYNKSTMLELWSGDTLLDPPVQTEWVGGYAGAMEFEVALPPDVAARLVDEPLVLAAPGMVEAGLPVGVLPKLDLVLRAEIDRDGLIWLHLSGETPLDGEIEAVIRAASDGRILQTAPAIFTDGQATLHLDGGAPMERVVASLRLGGEEIPGLAAQVSRTLGRLVRNGSFQSWSGGGASDWSPGPEAKTTRGYYAFPDRIAQTQALSGDFIRVTLEASGDARLALSQVLSGSVFEGDTGPAALMARADDKAHILLRLVDELGRELASMPLQARRPWTWAFAAEPLELTQASSEVTLEVIVGPGDAIEVDIAGVAFGAEGFAEPQPAWEPPPPADNLVVNADLHDWPSGVVIESLMGRGEIARGWYGYNRRSSGPIRARAIFGDIEDDRVAMAIGADRVPEYCRLEVKLDASVTRAPVVLSFEVGMPPQARRLFQESATALPEFLLIDRIMILKRTPRMTERGFSLVDETVASPGRKLLVSRRYHRFDLPFSIEAPASSGDFDWEDAESEDADVEYFAVFEFHRPFAVAMRDVSVRTGGPASAVAPAPYLALEDYNIAAQATHVSGLDSWVGAAVVSASDTPGADETGDIARWAWSGQTSGTVEVVICVYNAVEETLACLKSLIGATQVPHTVRIIDDGSAPTTVERLYDFVADKPWMRLTPNPENRGYTFSADRGIRESEADWVVLLNSDTIVTRGWLEGLLEAAVSDPAIAFVGPLSNAATFQSVPDLYDSRNQWKTNELPQGWTAQRMADVVAQASEKVFPKAPLLNGFCTLIRRSVFMEVGGLNHHAFPTGYGEENDLCLRVVKAGYSLAIADHVYVYHSKSASFGSARRTELAKAGGKTFRDLHPDADLTALTTSFRDTPALVTLRSEVRKIYDKHL